MEIGWFSVAQAILEIRLLPQPPVLELPAITNLSFFCTDDYTSGTKKLTKTKTKAAQSRRHGRGLVSCWEPFHVCTPKKINLQWKTFTLKKCSQLAYKYNHQILGLGKLLVGITPT